jgi:hypothetical protein
MLLDLFRKIFSDKDLENKHHNIELGCMYCSQFTGKGCKLTGIIFPDWMNVAVRPKNCPIVDMN